MVAKACGCVQLPTLISHAKKQDRQMIVSPVNSCVSLCPSAPVPLSRTHTFTLRVEKKLTSTDTTAVTGGLVM